MSHKRLLSDLVRDSKIETEALGSCYKHVFYVTGQSAQERQVRREERWVRQAFIGRGAYGTVYLEKCENESKEKLRAVKEIKKFGNPGEELEYARELEAIVKFSNPKYSHCFVRSDGWFELDDSIFITMEYLNQGDLQRHLTRPLPEIEARQITGQVLEGLNFMHENGFAHRDLKPGNIMVVTAGPDWFVKIADFGISKRRQPDITTLHTLQRGTLGYAAPEALGFTPESTYTYTFSVDMWSLGAVAFRLLTEATAFQYPSDLFQYINGMLEFPTAKLESRHVSQQGQEFIVTLMNPDPKHRLSASSASQHSWMSIELHHPIESHIESADRPIFLEAPDDEAEISSASEAWSTRHPISPIPEKTLRASTTINYQQPFVTDCSDDEDSNLTPKLPVNSVILLDVVTPDANLSDSYHDVEEDKWTPIDEEKSKYKLPCDVSSSDDDSQHDFSDDGLSNLESGTPKDAFSDIYSDTADEARITDSESLDSADESAKDDETM